MAKIGLVSIPKIQGTTLGPAKRHLGSVCTTSGVVTHIHFQKGGGPRGFFIQDSQGDGNAKTSDALYVRVPESAKVPKLTLGSQVTVTGKVEDGKRSATDLPTTTLVLEAATVGEEVELPAPVRLGQGQGKVAIPDRDITKAKALLASLEGMRVEIEEPLAVGPFGYGALPVVADGGRGTTGLSPRQTLLTSRTDRQPEVVEVKVNTFKDRGFTANVGDTLGTVVGPLSWRMGGLHIDATDSVTHGMRRAALTHEVTNLRPTERQLTIATYNLYNIDPTKEVGVENQEEADDDIGDGTMAGRARQIVENLASPDILAVQEVQDDSGTQNDGVVTAGKTAQALIDAIIAAGGPRYEWVSIDPEDGKDGGVPGGNIRVGYFYNPTRVAFDAASLKRLGDDNEVFTQTRKSLEAVFSFRGESVRIINNHLAAKRGSKPAPLGVGKPVNGQVGIRTAQAKFINAYAERVLSEDPKQVMVLLGDMNEEAYNSPLTALAGKSFVNLNDQAEHSYIFMGRASSIDHILVPKHMKSRVETDTVHVNTMFTEKNSDHDPKIARITFKK